MFGAIFGGGGGSAPTAVAAPVSAIANLFSGSPAAQPFKYEVIGGNLQAARVILEPGQVIIGEGGSMLFMDEGINWECRMGDGNLANPDQGWWATIKAGFARWITNESLFFMWFNNPTGIPLTMSVAAPTMGSIVDVNLHQFPESTIIAQGGAFLCASQGTHLSVELLKKFGAGIFGGEGFFLQRLTAEAGSAGQLLMHGGGTIIRKELNNEEYILDCGCLMAFTRGIDYDIGWAGMSNAFGGGEFFLAKLRGTGSLWIQSSPFDKFADRVIAEIPVKQENNNN